MLTLQSTVDFNSVQEVCVAYGDKWLEYSQFTGTSVCNTESLNASEIHGE